MSRADDIKRVCFCEALYPLTFYLLLSSIEEIKHTMFFVDRRIAKCIQSRLPHIVVTDIDNKHKAVAPIFGWWMRLYCHIVHPYLYTAEVYGLDFKWQYLQGVKLKYIEDGPNSFNLWETGPMYKRYQQYCKKPSFIRWVYRMLRGEFYQHPIATSNAVTDIFTTAKYEKPYHKGKKLHVYSWKELWNKSTKEKQQYIYEIFGISQKDIEGLQKKKIILLTQAFSDDKMMTEDEQIELYRKILQNYSAKDVVIKPHPRDFINYKKAFPNVMYFDKVVPMQILKVWGVDFEVIATVTSSSALTFGIDKKIDWYGSYMHPGIIKNEGLRTLENAIENYKKQNNMI